MKYKIHTTTKKLLADTHTPVGIYLKLRDKFPDSILLECSDYHSSENSFSFICCLPLATIMAANETITESYPDGQTLKIQITAKHNVPESIKSFTEKFLVEQNQIKFIPNGFFGYASYDAVKYFEDIEINSLKKPEKEIPDLVYSVYKYVIAINHFNDELYLLENSVDGESSSLDNLESILYQHGIPKFRFSVSGNEDSNLSDEQFINMVKKGKEECRRGNVFQVVLSREFMQSFKGDEFNVYRALRSINPSPYLFYFDYGNFKIFGSSPEAQLVVKNNKAEIHPIAGTFRRTGDENRDSILTEKLRNDKKENSEHVMLVDLARNDLSRHCTHIDVEVFAETQHYSHVIHLVSKVSGILKKNTGCIQVFADSFPTGTLSGAPKYKAMQIIDRCENDSRGYYGGCIGFIGFNGDFNHAIVIRSFLSKNNKLFYRAGAGIVIDSIEQNELEEVKNKLAALKSAIELAKQI